MNSKHLQKIFEEYKEKYSIMNDKKHHEITKWEAVQHFQDKWDIDAPDFGKMFKDAMAKTENLVNTNAVQPATGIEYLCGLDEKMMELVREEFRKLFSADGEDYVKRLDRIDTFVNRINARLEKHIPGRWYYDQDRRSVIMYLSLADSNHNYMYKSPEARIYAKCVEFGDEVSGGKDFHLDDYYRMCDELVEEIKNDPSLCDMVNQALDKEQKKKRSKTLPKTALQELDPNYHILAYDIMHCATAYDFYEDISIKKKSSTATQKFAVKQARAKELFAKREALSVKQNKVIKELSGIEEPKLKKLKVKNHRYGEGVVTDQEGHYLTVKFKREDKKFIFPDAVAREFLFLEDEATEEICKRMVVLEQLDAKIARQVRLINIELESLGE